MIDHDDHFPPPPPPPRPPNNGGNVPPPPGAPAMQHGARMPPPPSPSVKTSASRAPWSNRGYQPPPAAAATPGGIVARPMARTDPSPPNAPAMPSRNELTSSAERLARMNLEPQYQTRQPSQFRQQQQSGMPAGRIAQLPPANAQPSPYQPSTAKPVFPPASGLSAPFANGNLPAPPGSDVRPPPPPSPYRPQMQQYQQAAPMQQQHHIPAPMQQNRFPPPLGHHVPPRPEHLQQRQYHAPPLHQQQQHFAQPHAPPMQPPPNQQHPHPPLPSGHPHQQQQFGQHAQQQPHAQPQMQQPYPPPYPQPPQHMQQPPRPPHPMPPTQQSYAQPPISTQHQQQPMSPPPNRPLQEKDKIDPSQIPRIPLFTRPHHAPAAIYPAAALPPGTSGGSDASASLFANPPPADSRYVAYNAPNCSPRLMRSTVCNFPMDNATNRKVEIPLGLVVTPLGCLTTLCGRVEGDVILDGRNEVCPRERLDHISLEKDDTPDPERVVVLRAAEEKKDRSLVPPRCNRCHAYLNPFCTTEHQPSFSYSGGYAPVQRYNCNLCGTKNSIVIPDEYIAGGLVDAATRNATVEYEVGGPYVVRDAVQNVRIYGVEYTPRRFSDRVNDGSHHGSMKSFGWGESLFAIRKVVNGLRDAALKEDCITPTRVGVFGFCQNMLVFPYVKEELPKGSDYDSNDSSNSVMNELGVCIVHDVEVDPFCPLPLHAWTYDIGTNDTDWTKFCDIIDSITTMMERVTEDFADKEEDWQRNCGGAALAALVDALRDSGGRATLITSRRPNYGVGALRDREVGQQSPYRSIPNEQRLFTPLQRLSFTATALKAGEEKDRQASLFYKQLGEDCSKFRVSMDIVVTSSLLKLPKLPTGQHPQSVPGPSGAPMGREFLDVATLSELCRVSGGKFKWLRVGNECGIAIDEKYSFTLEQIMGELKRSGLGYSGSDAVFKLRCSNGVQVKSYSPTLPAGTLIGDGIVDSAELELPSIDSSTSIAVMLEHKIGGVVNTRDSRKNDAPLVFFQSAVLYTTLTGKRRVRVSTLGLPTTKVAADVFRSADLGTVATIMTRQAVSDLTRSDEGSLKLARDNAFQQCVSILANYRLNTNARTSPSGQLILPESLQLLPLFCLSLRKSRMFRHSLQLNAPSARPFPTSDERAYHIFYASVVSPNIALQCIHPNLLQISDLRTHDGDWIAPQLLQANKFLEDEVVAASLRQVCQLPKATNPSMTCLDESGMYILDDRFAFYLFVGRDVPEEKWQNLISFKPDEDEMRASLNAVPMGSLSLASTEAAHKLSNILQQLRMMNAPNPTLAMNVRPTDAPLILVFVGRGSVFEEEMDSLLIDDPDTHEKSYVDFLCTMHRAIRDKNANAQ